jgi:hypothetical protein
VTPVAVTTAAVVTATGVTVAVVLVTNDKPKQAAAIPVPPPPASSQSLAPTTPKPPSTTPTTLDLGQLPGAWVAHSSGFTVKPDGTFTMTERIYGTTPDQWVHAGGHITSASGGGADGEITQSDVTTGQVSIPLGPVHVTFASGTDTVDVRQGGIDYTFCGTKAPVGYCGA